MAQKVDTIADAAVQSVVRVTQLHERDDTTNCDLAYEVHVDEHFLGTEEVKGSTPFLGSYGIT